MVVQRLWRPEAIRRMLQPYHLVPVVASRVPLYVRMTRGFADPVRAAWDGFHRLRAACSVARVLP